MHYDCSVQEDMAARNQPSAETRQTIATERFVAALYADAGSGSLLPLPLPPPKFNADDANVLTMVVLFRGNCGLSKCISHYMFAMAMADLLVMMFCVIGYHIVMYQFPTSFLSYTSACKVGMYLNVTSLQASVWFTVLFTVDRFVAICCQKLKAKYCTVRTAVSGIITVALLLHLQNVPFLFEFNPVSVVNGNHWGCKPSSWFMTSPVGASFSILQSILTVILPFVLISLFNCVTVRRILLAGKLRRGLRGHSSQTQKDPEMESRRKSIILLFSVSGSFILLWLTSAVTFPTTRLAATAHYDGDYTDFAYVATEAGHFLMYLSSCTNTCIYTATQAKFREEIRRVLKSPWTLFSILVKRHSYLPSAYLHINCEVGNQAINSLIESSISNRTQQNAISYRQKA
ncbi:probable G-protein coupled receptor 139 [Hypanus sabinus]|uniref:probable G-protein coupled receptor 139 n=1 Tax=Hypanus sabinus TaxID=79690 RepID=UPI0028C39751|nr:probable G-protein coupled receptor 139 [Hypanus sabinus]